MGTYKMKCAPAGYFSSRSLLLGLGVATTMVLGSFAAEAQGQTKVDGPAGNTGEQRVARALDAARNNPLELRGLLVEMPKGGDLHNHLSGAIYAETWIREAAEDHLCADRATFSLSSTPDTAAANAPAGALCGDGKVAASEAFTDQHLYEAMVDAFSMRGFVASTGVTAHDHFFDAFEKFDPISDRHLGDWLDEVATRAARQNEQYLELMHTPSFGHAFAVAKEIGWMDDFGKLREQLLAHGLRDDVSAVRADLDKADALREEHEHCRQAEHARGCSVEIRYLYQVLRGFPKQDVYAQLVLAFETAASDPRVVGVNMVMPEDGYIAMRDYDLQMRMVGFLHGAYPTVRISLHAGELAPGLVPYEELCCHIRQAVEVAHAERIGHGVSVMFEDRPYDLLREMAARQVMVEINLTSNDVILGVKGNDNPFPIYRKAGVPVALSSDDEGVSRIDLTHEFVRAVETYGLSYSDLKELVRNSIEYSFLPGRSLWHERGVFTRRVPECAGGGDAAASSTCQGFLQANEKARQEVELETRFHKFELSQ
jgi:adenosine deaminase